MLLGSALLAVLPRGVLVLLAMAVFAAVLPWARNANFGLFSVFQTPLVIMLLDLADPTPSDLVGPRLVDTLIGCAIVLVFGYLLWPQTWRAPLDDALRGAATALDRFVDAAFTGTPEQIRRARRASYRALTELQTQLQRRLAEPPPISTRAAAWYPVIVQLERTSDAVTEAVIALRAGARGAPGRAGARAAPLDPGAGRRPAAAPVPRRHRDPRRGRAGPGRARGGRRPPAGPGTGARPGLTDRATGGWARQGSNLRPLACKARALPLSYAPRGGVCRAHPPGGQAASAATASFQPVCARASPGPLTSAKAIVPSASTRNVPRLAMPATSKNAP